MSSDNIPFVSVIIPGCNQEKNIESTVESAISLNEVAEVILVNESTFNSALEVSLKLADKYKKLKLIQLSSCRERKCMAASRNAGILESKFNFIAFLNPGDKYLSNRFIGEKKIFDKNPDVDVIYSSVSGDSLTKNRKLGDIRQNINNKNSHIDFYKFALSHPSRHPAFHINSITIRRNFLITHKLFDERLMVYEDSEYWKRLLRRGRFFPGQLGDPVSVITKSKSNNKNQMFESISGRLKMYAFFIDNIGVEQLYDFERDHLVENILRSKSRLTKNLLKRRLIYYFEKSRSTFYTNQYLRSFKSKSLKTDIK